MNNSTIIPLVLLAIVLISVILWLLLFSASSKWPSVDGKIITSSIKNITEEEKINGKRETRNTSQLFLRYDYNVNGQNYTGSHLVPEFKIIKQLEQSYGQSVNEFDTIQDAKDMQTKFPEGSTPKVFYNPKDPSQSCLMNGSLIKPGTYVGIVLVMTLGVGLMAFVIIKVF